MKTGAWDDGHDDGWDDPDNPAGWDAGTYAAWPAGGEARNDALAGSETAGGDPCGPAGGGSRLRRKPGTPTSSDAGLRRAPGDARLFRLASRLTDRDRAVVRAVARFGVLTSDQLEAMFFDSTRRAQVRLLALHRLGVLDRFRPYRPGYGTAPYHYVLGRAGAAVLAGESDDEREIAARRRRARGLALAHGQRLAHLVGVNGFHASLVAEARRSPGCGLEDWMTEPECTRWTYGAVRPDAWGRWREGGSTVEFFVEWDRGTESLGRLVAKLGDYEHFEAERGAVAWVLFVFPSARREGTARSALSSATVAVATAAAGGGCLRAAGPVWLTLDLPSGAGRLRLAELGLVPMPPEAEDRAQGSLRSWRYERRPGEEAEAW